MGHTITIPLDNDSAVGGWIAEPDGAPKGGLVVIQEIFGVNPHMRSVVDGYARDGYVAIAPAFFDPIERGVELGYDQAGFTRGLALVGELGIEPAVATINAAAALLRSRGLQVGAVGFCWGGSMAFLANTRLGLPAVSYYGARTMPYLHEPLRAPMVFHFGEQDSAIPAKDIDAHRTQQPTAEAYTYPAGHGFNRDVDAHAYHSDSAALAHQRTLALFAKALQK